MGDRYDEQAAREVWQRLLRRATQQRRLPTAEAERLASFGVHVADAIGEKVLLQCVASAWAQGWQPAEVVHHVTLRGGRAAARLVDLAIVADHDRRPGQVVDPRWRAQVDGLDAHTQSTRLDWMRQWRRREGMDRRQCYDTVGACWQVLARLPRLPILLPPPGHDQTSVEIMAPSPARVADPVLDRIRKLLAKAESTPFPAEAEALTAKAQQLMARHAVDRAEVRDDASAAGPRMTRFLLEPPYAAAKGVLLGAVPDANRCRAVQLSGLDLVVVVGHADDLAAVDVLFTSLLVQTGNGLAAAARGAGAGSRERSAAFRQSFHLGFAARVRERLAAVDAAVLAEPAAAGALPVLRSRADAVEEAVDRLFGGRLTEGRVPGRWDALGAARGRAAADRACLRAGELSA